MNKYSLLRTKRIFTNFIHYNINKIFWFIIVATLFITLFSIGEQKVSAQGIVFTCPPDIIAGVCKANSINLGQPPVGCTGCVWKNDAPSSFPLGTTIVTWSLIKDGNIIQTCIQTVKIVKEFMVGPGKMFSKIQKAIDAACDGDEIIVFPGVYQEDIFTEKDITIISTDPTDPDVVASTVISGVVSFPTVQLSSNYPTLSGFTVKNGDWSGICILGGSSPTISHCVISENEGHGIYCHSSNPIITNCTIRGNKNRGIDISDEASPTISHCVISENGVSGILCESSNPIITNCTIRGNIGTGVSIYQSSLTLSHCTISRNKSVFVGGGISCGNSELIMSDCNIIDNSSALIGGGIYCNGSSANISNCTIIGNSAESNVHGGGGGICHSGNSLWLNISGCTINGNSAGNHGGGIACYKAPMNISGGTIISGNSTLASGGGIFIIESSLSIITNCTITDNSSGGSGGGITCYNASMNISESTISKNSAIGGNGGGNIISGTGGGIFIYGTSLPIITNCTITDNSSGGRGGGIDCVNAPMNISGSTISGNSAHWCGSISDCRSFEDIKRSITDNIISGNTADYCNECCYPWAPVILETTPMQDANDVLIDTNITITFNKSMSRSITQNAFSMIPDVPYPPNSFTWTNDDKTLIFNPEDHLLPYQAYTVLINSSAEDIYGNKLNFNYMTCVDNGVDGEYRFDFTTLPPDKHTEMKMNPIVLNEQIKDILEDEVFFTDSGGDLDQYLFKSHNGGYLEFDIEIKRYCGPVDKEGHLTLMQAGCLENMGAYITLNICAFDVDNKYSGKSYRPENDEVYINGHKLSRNLLSPQQEDGNEEWRKYEYGTTTYEQWILLHHLIFPQKGDKNDGITPAKNTIRIAIDVDNAQIQEDFWAVAIDWAYLQFHNFPRPIVFIHGKGCNSQTWKIYSSDGHKDNTLSGGWYKWFEDKGFVVGTVDVWSQGNPATVMVPDRVYTRSDYVDNNGDTKIDEVGETNVSHSYTNRDWLEMPSGNRYCFSNMLDTRSDKTNSNYTAWRNMEGMSYIANIFGTRKVHFVSHSTGSFYGRKYIDAVMDLAKENKNKDKYKGYPLVEKFIMLSGPNDGQATAKVLKEVYKDIYWLSGQYSPCEKFYVEDEWITFNKNVKNNKFVTYYTIGGHCGWKVSDIPDPTRPYCDLRDWHPDYGSFLTQSIMANAAYQLLGGKVGEDWPNKQMYLVSYPPFYKTHIPNDCLCTLDSMSLGGDEIFLGTFALNHHHTRTDHRIRDKIYDTLLPKDEITIKPRQRFLTASSEKVQTKTFISLSPPNIPDMPSQYTYLDDTITSFETKEHELMILGDMAIIHLFWDPNIGDLDLVATDPDQTELSSSELIKDSGHILLLPSSFLPGTWKFTITSGNLSENLDYHLIAYMTNGEIQLKPGTNKHDYQVGETVLLTCELTFGSGPFITATMSADIYSVEDKTLLGQINLYDDGSHGDITAGDSIYTNDEWTPLQRGKQRFEIQATIMQAGQEFSRQATEIMIDVIDSSITFDGNNTDEGVDTNANGRFDYLTITIGLTSTITGNYSLGLELYDPNDHLISSASEEISLHEGANTVELQFEGNNIFNLGFNGPYHLKNGIITAEDGKLMALSEEVYTTGFYTFTDFEGPPISYAETHTVTGIDDNNNAKYNYLKWDFSLLVAVEGMYTINASLKSSTDQLIETISDSRYLNTGENFQSYYFDGITIRNSGFDGPYVIDNVSVTGGGNKITVEDIYTISGFTHTDFEEIDSIDIALYPNDILFEYLDSNSVTISATVHNFGEDTSETMSIEIYQGPKGSGSLIGEDTIEGLNRDEAKTKAFNWNIGSLPQGVYTIYVYVNDDRLMNEYDYSNNLSFKDFEIIRNTYYLDGDEDGFGDPNTPLEGDNQPEGYVLDNTDCLDSDLNISPGAEEICDGKDNNCDGEIDEEGAQDCQSYYRDEDDDGYGVDGDCRCLCSSDVIEKYTANQPGDPDDTDPNIICQEQCLFKATITARGQQIPGINTTMDEVIIGRSCNPSVLLPTQYPQAYTVNLMLINLLDKTTYYKKEIKQVGNNSEKWLLQVDINRDYADPNLPGYYPVLSWDKDSFCSPKHFKLWSSNSNGDLITLLVNDLRLEDAYQTKEEDSMYFCITWSECMYITLNLPLGWSMISLPVWPESLVRKDLFPEAEAVYGFDKVYHLINENDELGVGKGYWIYLPKAATYTICGLPIESNILNADSGWSMIGACSVPSQASVDAGVIKVIFGFTNRYNMIEPWDVLKPGQGYWIYITQPARITVE